MISFHVSGYLLLFMKIMFQNCSLRSDLIYIIGQRRLRVADNSYNARVFTLNCKTSSVFGHKTFCLLKHTLMSKVLTDLAPSMACLGSFLKQGVLCQKQFENYSLELDHFINFVIFPCKIRGPIVQDAILLRAF